ncbi:Proline-rich protein [Labilithrix luteola]|uniref:Proline-rich protein n=1 Tax=Labilithrix luteola TaxID=1391654 RepID=A0A0K1PKN9_9BACT|nr:hypothetical protein [Labilithrix luteola]AKU94103.1 Proline-rich protein [Labilithrix luteola]
MFRTTLPLALSAILFAAACGGSDPAPKAPETEPVASAAPAPEPTPAPTAEAKPEAAPAPAAEPAPAPVSIAVAAMKFTPAKKGKTKALEIKGDGSIQQDGKPFLKISGDHVEDASGKTLVTVGSDGALTGDVKSGLKLVGDDIVGDDAKISVGDDGTATITLGKKSESFGKFEGGAGAKKAAALVTLVLGGVPKDAAKPAEKAAPAKPAAGDKKDAAKPAAAPADKKAPAKK